MDTPIEAFLTDVMGLQGESPAKIRATVRDYVTKYETMFRNAQLDHRSKDIAVRGCRTLCLKRVFREIAECESPSTKAHLQTVFGVISSLDRP
jgi:hypothetical protein